MGKLIHCKPFLFLAVITFFPTRCTQFTNSHRMPTVPTAYPEQIRPGLYPTWIPDLKKIKCSGNLVIQAELSRFWALSLRGGGVSILGNDISSIRKLERKLGGREKISRSGKKDGWDSMMSGLDKVLAMKDSDEEDPKTRKPMKSDSHDVHNEFDVPVKAARERENENGKKAFSFSILTI